MSEETTTSATWRTCDLKAVAFLLYSGHPVLDVLPDHGRVLFVFADSQERKNMLLSFLNKEQRVEPIAFIECQMRARDMVTQGLIKKGD